MIYFMNSRRNSNKMTKLQKADRALLTYLERTTPSNSVRYCGATVHTHARLRARMLPSVAHPWRSARRASGSTRLPPPLPSFISQPSLPSAQVAERTAAVGCSLTSPTHGQRSSELPQRATAPLAERTLACVCFCVFVVFVVFCF